MSVFARLLALLPFTVNANGRKHDWIIRTGRMLTGKRYAKVTYKATEIHTNQHPIADIIQYATANFFKDFERSAWGIYLKQNVQPGDVYWDIGANLGGYAFLAKRLKAEVIAFEPMPALFQFLNDNPQAFGKAYPYALSNINGRAIFYTSSANVGGCSLVGEDARMGQLGYDGRVEVEVMRAESLINRVPLPRWIKIDVEGNEEATLQGLLPVIECADVHAVWCEVRGSTSDRNPNSYLPVCALMRQVGFIPHIFDGRVLRPFDVEQATNLPQFFDLLFLRR